MPESPEKYIFFPKEELNYKGKPCGEKIRNGDINHNTFHENCLQNLDKQGSQGRFTTFLYKLEDITQKDFKCLWKSYIL